MIQAVKTIVIPVQLDASYLSIVKQTAMLAKEHSAEIHLLNVTKTAFAYTFSPVPRYSVAKNFYRFCNEKQAQINSWKNWLQQTYNIKVKCVIELGNWQNQLLNYAKSVNADLIVLKDGGEKQRWFSFRRTPTETIIKKSKCQVITMFSEKKSMAEWKQVVIPITDFIPETRIQTIQKLAKIFKMKIHLLALPSINNKKENSSFKLLTDTVKMLRRADNLQVECRFLDKAFNPVQGYMQYSNNIGADALMTNMKNSNSIKLPFKNQLQQFFAETSYGKDPDVMFPVMI